MKERCPTCDDNTRCGDEWHHRNEAAPSPGNREQALREALEWTLDLIDIYDKKLVEMEEPYASVYSDLHVAAKKKARAALAAYEPASQGAQAGEFDARAWLLANTDELIGPASSRSFPTRTDIRIAERAYAAGQAAQPLQREAGLTEHDIEMTLLRSRLRTIHLAGTHGMSNREVADRVAELENLSDQARQYVQNAQQREHRINELEAQLAVAPFQPQVEELRELSEKWHKNGEATRWRDREEAVTLQASAAQMKEIHGNWNRLATLAKDDYSLWPTIEAIATIMFRSFPVDVSQPSPSGCSMLTCADELDTLIRKWLAPTEEAK